MAVNRAKNCPQKPELTLGPVLFHWAPEKWRDFYFRIADEAPVDAVYVGEVVCAKRAVFYESLYQEVCDRLQKAGKRAVLSTIGEVALRLDRNTVESICGLPDVVIEANDVSALWHMNGRPHVIGPLLNTYNEDTLAFFAAKGAKRFCLPPELPAEALRILSGKAEELGVTLEVQVYGRASLALSARCYHARAHGRTKDSCQFVCEEDPDGMTLKTLSGKPFLAINGIQTLSYTCLNLLKEMPEMVKMGIGAFRLSPHTHDMVGVAELFRAALEGKIENGKALEKLKKLAKIPFSNGFYHKTEGFRWIETPRKSA